MNSSKNPTSSSHSGVRPKGNLSSKGAGTGQAVPAPAAGKSIKAAKAQKSLKTGLGALSQLCAGHVLDKASGRLVQRSSRLLPGARADSSTSTCRERTPAAECANDGLQTTFFEPLISERAWMQTHMEESADEIGLEEAIEESADQRQGLPEKDDHGKLDAEGEEVSVESPTIHDCTGYGAIVGRRFVKPSVQIPFVRNSTDSASCSPSVHNSMDTPLCSPRSARMTSVSPVPRESDAAVMKAQQDIGDAACFGALEHIVVSSERGDGCSQPELVLPRTPSGDQLTPESSNEGNLHSSAVSPSSGSRPEVVISLLSALPTDREASPQAVSRRPQALSSPSGSYSPLTDAVTPVAQREYGTSSTWPRSKSGLGISPFSTPRQAPKTPSTSSVATSPRKSLTANASPRKANSGDVGRRSRSSASHGTTSSTSAPSATFASDLPLLEKADATLLSLSNSSPQHVVAAYRRSSATSGPKRRPSADADVSLQFWCHGGSSSSICGGRVGARSQSDSVGDAEVKDCLSYAGMLDYAVGVNAKVDGAAKTSLLLHGLHKQEVSGLLMPDPPCQPPAVASQPDVAWMVSCSSDRAVVWRLDELWRMVATGRAETVDPTTAARDHSSGAADWEGVSTCQFDSKRCVEPPRRHINAYGLRGAYSTLFLDTTPQGTAESLVGTALAATRVQETGSLLVAVVAVSSFPRLLVARVGLDLRSSRVAELDLVEQPRRLLISGSPHRQACSEEAPVGSPVRRASLWIAAAGSALAPSSAHHGNVKEGAAATDDDSLMVWSYSSGAAVEGTDFAETLSPESVEVTRGWLCTAHNLLPGVRVHCLCQSVVAPHRCYAAGTLAIVQVLDMRKPPSDATIGRIHIRSQAAPVIGLQSIARGDTETLVVLLGNGGVFVQDMLFISGELVLSGSAWRALSLGPPPSLGPLLVGALRSGCARDLDTPTEIVHVAWTSAAEDFDVSNRLPDVYVKRAIVCVAESTGPVAQVAPQSPAIKRLTQSLTSFAEAGARRGYASGSDGASARRAARVYKDRSESRPDSPPRAADSSFASLLSPSPSRLDESLVSQSPGTPASGNSRGKRLSKSSLSGSTTPKVGSLSGATTPKVGCLSGATTPKVGCLSGATTPKLSGATTPKVGCLSGATTPKLSGAATPRALEQKTASKLSHERIHISQRCVELVQDPPATARSSRVTPRAASQAPSRAASPRSARESPVEATATARSSRAMSQTVSQAPSRAASPRSARECHVEVVSSPAKPVSQLSARRLPECSVAWSGYSTPPVLSSSGREDLVRRRAAIVVGSEGVSVSTPAFAGQMAPPPRVNQVTAATSMPWTALTPRVPPPSVQPAANTPRHTPKLTPRGLLTPRVPPPSVHSAAHTPRLPFPPPGVDSQLNATPAALSPTASGHRIGVIAAGPQPQNQPTTTMLYLRRNPSAQHLQSASDPGSQTRLVPHSVSQPQLLQMAQRASPVQQQMLPVTSPFAKATHGAVTPIGFGHPACGPFLRQPGFATRMVAPSNIQRASSPPLRL